MNGWVDCMILHGFNVWDEGMMSVTSAPRTTSKKPKHVASTVPGYCRLGPWKSALLQSGFAVISADVRGAGILNIGNGEPFVFPKIYSTTSLGRKFAPVEGLSHDLVCTGSIYHVHFAWQVWHGQLSPRFKFNKLKSFSGVEIDRNHVDKRILGGKGFAVGRLKRHNYCPASALRNRCCIDTKRCSGGYTQPQVLRLR